MKNAYGIFSLRADFLISYLFSSNGKKYNKKAKKRSKRMEMIIKIKNLNKFFIKRNVWRIFALWREKFACWSFSFCFSLPDLKFFVGKTFRWAAEFLKIKKVFLPLAFALQVSFKVFFYCFLIKWKLFKVLSSVVLR